MTGATGQAPPHETSQEPIAVEVMTVGLRLHESALGVMSMAAQLSCSFCVSVCQDAAKQPARTMTPVSASDSQGVVVPKSREFSSSPGSQFATEMHNLDYSGEGKAYCHRMLV